MRQSIRLQGLSGSLANSKMTILPSYMVRREVEPCKRIYSLLGHSGALSFETPVDFNRFPRRMQERALEWLTGHV